MRIIAGSARGRTLQAPAGNAVRPTSDKARGALFSILSQKLSGARFFDLCAGTGAIGLEALSRGAESAVFVEKDRAALETLRANIEACGFGDRATVHPGEVLAFLAGPQRPGAEDLVFADPPWAGDLGEQILAALGGASPSPGEAPASPGGASPALLVLEHESRRKAPEMAGALGLLRTVVHGDTALSFYTVTGH